jgi:hypothetical protein
MLGRYENFPEIIHGVARFTYRASTRKAQQAIATAFCQLNQRRCRFEEIAHSSTPNCEVDFELGIGENSDFTFLDDDESNRLKAEVARRTLAFLDFLCILQYHVIDDSGRRSPLKFDYFFLRFTFGKNFMELLVSHERGPQRVHAEDLIGFLMKEVEEKLAEQHPVTLKLEEMRTV